jgi:hypothetical protein
MWSTGLDRAVSGKGASFYQVTGQSSKAVAGDRSDSRQTESPAWLRVIPPPLCTLRHASDETQPDRSYTAWLGGFLDLAGFPQLVPPRPAALLSRSGISCPTASNDQNLWMVLGGVT